MDKDMQYGDDYKYIPTTSIGSGVTQVVAPDVTCHTIQVVNICIVSKSSGWVLVDAGMPHSAEGIIQVTEEIHGKGTRPEAIILTHGHFDHVGAIIELIEHWKVPVYAHQLELPFLTGKTDYPEPDPTVEGGLIAKLSPLFPNDAINLGEHVKALPEDGSIPAMTGWKWYHTPGHTPGHISLFREHDRVLIAGDAFVTVKQDSLYKVLTQEQEISGPPRYFTTDWKDAWDSVKRLASLKPAVAITGHGLPMAGELLTSSLETLVNEFDKLAIPDYGRYVNGDAKLH
ncbi:MBL fold metallo-hydrolase [Anaerobacillus alkaliphilus]|uniref:MBL fold metallo-hydrolase n=1 Tax=Anaerobacillus alkaliphilus TaxID=1548597 RepID=A0A4Q0VTH3_9BACI|nr:MBL fold metallo-hydrolase [Anaerobacillus alkaliphilus]RXJ01890.1 MBL fold metallo-hydrolase [Anaerobacillus alkaliphilus]